LSLDIFTKNIHVSPAAKIVHIEFDTAFNLSYNLKLDPFYLLDLKMIHPMSLTLFQPTSSRYKGLAVCYRHDTLVAYLVFHCDLDISYWVGAVFDILSNRMYFFTIVSLWLCP
jgi:hypothetical protein